MTLWCHNCFQLIGYECLTHIFNYNCADRTFGMHDIIKQWLILCLLPMRTSDTGLSISILLVTEHQFLLKLASWRLTIRIDHVSKQFSFSINSYSMNSAIQWSAYCRGFVGLHITRRFVGQNLREGLVDYDHCPSAKTRLPQFPPLYYNATTKNWQLKIL